jgi:hypothetical protein
MELPLSRNWEERGWKPKFSRGRRSGGSGPLAKRADVSRRRMDASHAREGRCGVEMREAGTGMALGAYLYKLIPRRSNVSQTQELRQRMQSAQVWKLRPEPVG